MYFDSIKETSVFQPVVGPLASRYGPGRALLREEGRLEALVHEDVQAAKHPARGSCPRRNLAHLLAGLWGRLDVLQARIEWRATAKWVINWAI